MTTDGPWTLWVSVHSVHYILYIGRRTSYIGRRTSYNVALSPELSEFQCWNGQPQTILTRLRQCQSMTLHSPLNSPSLGTYCTSYIAVVHRASYVVHRASYVVRRPSYIALRTSHIVRCTSLHVVSVEWVSHRLYWLGRNNVSPWYCTTPWALRVSVHCISTSYIVHRPSYVVHRTPYVGRA